MKPRAKSWVMGGGVVGVLLMNAGFAGTLAAQFVSGSDSVRAVRLLDNARGANPVMCELAMRSIDNRYGNWGSAGRAPDAIIGYNSGYRASWETAVGSSRPFYWGSQATPWVSCSLPSWTCRPGP